MVDSWVGDDEKSWLLEGLLDLVGKATWGETSEDGCCSGVGSELEKSTLGVWSSRDDDNVSWVLNSSDSASGEKELLPSLLDVDDVWSCKTRYYSKL